MVYNITHIEWDFDVDDIFTTINEMTTEQASEILGVDIEMYKKITTEELCDCINEIFDTNPNKFCEIFDLPTSIVIPESVVGDEDNISEWLSNEYGFCIRGLIYVKEEY